MEYVKYFWSFSGRSNQDWVWIIPLNIFSSLGLATASLFNTVSGHESLLVRDCSHRISNSLCRTFLSWLHVFSHDFPPSEWLRGVIHIYILTSSSVVKGFMMGIHTLVKYTNANCALWFFLFVASFHDIRIQPLALSSLVVPCVRLLLPVFAPLFTLSISFQLFSRGAIFGVFARTRLADWGYIRT